MFKKFIHVQTPEAYRAELAYAHEHDPHLPDEIVYSGTVKLHGTNVGIVVAPDGTLSAQSRNRAITPEDDNAGFARYLANYSVKDLFAPYSPDNDSLTWDEFLRSLVRDGTNITYVVYGEWVGPGIQKNTACSLLPERRFVAFAVGFENSDHLYPAPPMKAPFDQVASVDLELRIKSDGSNYLDELAKAMELTAQVDAKCPWAKARGFVGHGEGIVWRPRTTEWSKSARTSSRRLWLKTKGEAHKSKTKVKRPKEDLDHERQVFLDLYEQTDGPTRVEQGVAYVREMGQSVDMKSIGTFIQWFNQDFARECASQVTAVAEAEGLDPKALRKGVSSVAVQEYRALLMKD